MLTKEEFESLINSIKEKLDETTQALVSEDLLGVLSSYSNAVYEITSLGEKLSKMESDNAELLKVNGKLFQKIGFENEEQEEVLPEEEVKEEEISIEEVVDEKGELI